MPNHARLIQMINSWWETFEDCLDCPCYDSDYCHRIDENDYDNCVEDIYNWVMDKE